MKKIKFRKILLLVLWIIVVSGIGVTLGFVNAEQKEVKAKSLNIVIVNENENYFVDEDDIKAFLKDRNDTLLSQSVKDINVFELEQALNAHPAIAKAEVSVDVNGDVRIRLKQRKPIVRVVNAWGDSYYIDNESRLMPLSDNYTAHVLVVNGSIGEKYPQFYKYTIADIEKDTMLKRLSLLDDIYRIAVHVEKDTLLRSLVQQVYVSPEREFELYPAVGDHKIIFGDGNDIEEKFEKLKVFYKEGLNSMNNWNNYSTVNLKYKDQVVCIKKVKY
jgi:cell division protein FtsQ